MTDDVPDVDTLDVADVVPVDDCDVVAEVV